MSNQVHSARQATKCHWYPSLLTWPESMSYPPLVQIDVIVKKKLWCKRLARNVQHTWDKEGLYPCPNPKMEELKLTSARPYGPKTNKATTTTTRASGAPTPNRDAYTPLPLHLPFLSAKSHYFKYSKTLRAKILTKRIWRYPFRLLFGYTNNKLTNIICIQFLCC